MRGALVLLGLVSWLCGGCGGATLPAPEAAAQSYADAVERGDAEAMRALLTQRGREELDAATVTRLLKENQTELRARAGGLRDCIAHGTCPSQARAQLLFDDGVEVALVGESGQFWIDGAGTLPARPSTPEAALVELRWALRRGRPEGLMALLTDERRRAIQLDLRTLDEALGELELALIEVRGDHAEATLSHGVRVSLRRVAGAWRVEEFP
ncbi:MAG TPA: hypothetical protein VLC09_20795 [Polyangiaceae bacterium]|nr:hypothetical protein [Polyangiaceae bacterium]